MSRPFAAAYADVYDALYADKDYLAECDLIEEAFRRFGDGATRSVLDLGCGTGSHALLLARRGYELTGVDCSPAMLRHARAKAERDGLPITWQEGDVRTVEAGAPFDAVLLMFAVLSYQRTNADVRATLANARRHLRGGGLLILDAWHGPGVLADPPQDRTKVVPTADGSVVRRASARLDARRHLCRVCYRLSQTTSDGDRASEETHVVRYFFPPELGRYLELCGFNPLVLSPFGTLDGEPDERAWNFVVVARAA